MSTRRRRERPLTDYGFEELLQLLNRPEECARLSDNDLDEFVFFAVGLYGRTCRGELIPGLWALYELFQRRLSPERRRRNYAAVQAELLRGEVTFNALLPYLFVDEDVGIVSTAALDYASTFPLQKGDPLSGPRDLLHHMGKGTFRNPVAVLGGLVALGDERVLTLLAPVTATLDRSRVKVLTQCSSWFLAHATIQFYLRWLESLDGGRDDGPFGAIAGFLYRVPQEAFAPEVLDVRRIFPVTPDRAMEVLGRWPIEDYAAQLRPRFEAILKRERGTKVMPLVMAAWGLQCEGRSRR